MSRSNSQKQGSHSPGCVVLIVTILVAIITATGYIIAAYSNQLPLGPLLQKVGLSATRTPDPCFSAKLVSPTGTHNRNDAAAAPVTNTLQIEWDQPSCIMTLEINQQNRMINKTKGVQSKQTIILGRPDSGETEIKLWREGESTSSDSIWVWIK